MRRTFLLVCILATAASVLVPGATPAKPSGCASPCPDLLTDPTTMGPYAVTEEIPEDDCQVVEGMVAPGVRRLLRFTFTTPNRGPGDLVIGRPQDRPDLFEYSPCHNHYHFREYADYRLWTPAQFLAWSVLRARHSEATPAELLAAHPELEPVVGAKRGFCAIDIRQYSPLAVKQFTRCRENQGISAGWADEYRSSLDGQFVDVTEVAAGDYVLETEVNAERLFAESAYGNNRAWVPVFVS